MIFVLLCYLFIIDHKHIAIDIRNMSVRPAENLKRAVYYFFGRNYMVIVTQNIMQINPAFGVAPGQGS